MSNVLRRTLILGLCLIVQTGLVVAQAPNWSNANDGICDPLVGATPGLYGLCLAFCEAHNCEPDFAAGDPFANCVPSDPNLLALYDDLKQPGDPEMPCVNFVGGCPCFTQEQSDAIPTPYFQCVIDFDFGGGTGLTTNIIYAPGTGVESSVNGSESHCAYANGLVDPPISNFQQINQSQAEDCREIVVNTITANADQCQLLCDPVCQE